MESFDDFTQGEPSKSRHGPISPTSKVSEPAESSASDKKPQTTTSPQEQTEPRETERRPLDQEEQDDLGGPEDAPLYPQLTHEPVESPSMSREERYSDEEEDDPGAAGLSKPFPRRSTPSPEIFQRTRGAVVTKVGEEGVMRMHRFTLYETQNLYYIIGSDMLRESYRILKISRTADHGELDVIEDEIVYTQRETQQIVNAVDEGNRATGGLKVKHGEFWGLLGFVKFTGAYYMIIVSKRSHIAVLGGHYVEKIDKTEMIQLTTTAAAKVKNEKHQDESRLLSIFGTVDLAKGFYYSRSYDITRTLQYNIIRERNALREGFAEPLPPDHNDMFIWNSHLLEPAKAILKNPFDWCVAVTHGYVDQSALSIYWGRVVYITIIARRSRFFAGARYLKRGANDLGYVANDVETEQIVSEMQTQSFHAPGPILYSNPLYTSYVQHRGSIPLHWSQDSTGVVPKPDINLSVVDPFFSATALHFDDLFQRYGSPLYCLNLIKIREKSPRESKLGFEYKAAIDYLNQFLPEDKRIIYNAFDMSRSSKSRDRDVIGELEEIAADVVSTTGFFQIGYDDESRNLQQGVARTNCIDCLDRTNAAQFIIGKNALGRQLQVLGVIKDPEVPFDSDAMNMFTNMWHDHGDTIAIQYGGSHLVNTMSTYRKINQWTSHSRDMVESFKRYYNNSFMDAQRQESYNLFLGSYTYRNGYPMLWDLSSDYYLHHTEPRSMLGRKKPGYRDWFTPANLKPPELAPFEISRDLYGKPLGYFDDYWDEYYRPLALSSFRKIFAYKMHSNLALLDMDATQGGKYDLSPFKVRAKKEEGASVKEKATGGRKKGVKVIAPTEEIVTRLEGTSIDARLAAKAPDKPKPQELGVWLDSQQQNHSMHRKYTGIIKDSSWEKASRTPTVPAMPPANQSIHDAAMQPTKQEREALAFEKMITDRLNPKVTEHDEYLAYVSHPVSIQPVTITETDLSKAPKEFIDYLARNQDPGDLTNEGYVLGGYGDVQLTIDERAEQSIDEYQEYIDIGLQENPLTVLDEDDTSKRYKKYKSWITRGKSLFKQRNNYGGELA